MNLIEQVARHLEFLGFGTCADSETDGDIFWGLMPDQPDTCICVFSTDSGYAGSPDGARVQIVTRARTARAAYEASQSVAEALAEYSGFLAGDGANASISVLSASAGIGADEKKREMYSSNYRIFYCDT